MDYATPIFVVGNSRSGTTMMGRMFARNSVVHTFGELHFFEQMVDATTVTHLPEWPDEKRLTMLERLLTSSREGLFSPVTSGRYHDDAQAILAATDRADPIAAYTAFLYHETHAAGMRVPCEQTPRYLYQAEEILSAYPDARMICLVRDPRAVLLSQKNKWKRRKLGASNMPLFWAVRAWVNYHPYTMSMMWASASRRARRLRKNDRFEVVRFEDLVAAPQETMQRLAVFAGVAFEPEMLQVAQVGSSSGEDRPDALGVDLSRVSSWQSGGLSDGELALCERTAGAEMETWGYALSGQTNGTMRHLGFMLGFGVKSTAALLMNFSRIKNLPETIRRRFG